MVWFYNHTIREYKMLNVKIKKFDVNAVIPAYAKHGDAGLDLTAVSKTYDKEGNVVYGTGLGFQIPFGYCGLLFPRSSNCKKDLILSNSVGVIDAGYRGEVSLKFKPSPIYLGNDTILPTLPNSAFIEPAYHESDIIEEYEIGDRVGQIIIIPIPEVNFTEVDELEESERGSGGYGSSGK